MNEIYKGKRAQISYVRSLRVFHHFGKFSQLCSKNFVGVFHPGSLSFSSSFAPFFFPPAPFAGALYKYHKM